MMIIQPLQPTGAASRRIGIYCPLGGPVGFAREEKMRDPMSLVVALSFFVALAIANDAPKIKGVPCIPTAKLPAHVAAPPGKFSLFADFKGKADLGVPLYLVNRSGKPVELFTYNGQPFIAVEYEAEPGKWRPARAVDYPLCGNDLRPVKLPDQTYMIVHGYVAPVGFKAKVRYRIDGEAKPLSDAGEGVVSHDDVSYLLVSKTVDFDLLSKVATGKFILPTETADYRPLAIARLAEPGFDREKAAAVLKTIAEGPDKRFAKMGRDALEFRRKLGSK
jgi:hypothetical protein